MVTNANRAGGRKQAPRPDAARDEAADTPDTNDDVVDAASADEAAAQPAIDTTLDAWSMQATRDQLAWEIGTCSALLRGARALREAQMQAAERAEATHLQAAEQLLTARGIADVAGVQMDLLRCSTGAAWARSPRAARSTHSRRPPPAGRA